MRKVAVYKMLFDIMKIILFCASCTIFAVPFLFSNDKLCLNIPSNGIPMLFLFMLTAMFESFDRMVEEFKLPGKQKALVIFEICLAFVVAMCTVIFSLLHNLIAISAIAVVCAFVYFVVKIIRLGRIIDKYRLG